MIDRIKEKYIDFDKLYPTRAKIIRYLISGSIVAIVSVFLLYVLTDLFGVWYLLSGIISFIIAFIINFSMQKFWTYRDMSYKSIGFQMMLFLLVAVVNLSINIILLYSFVECFEMNYLLSQVVILVLLASVNYFIYQIIIFRQHS